MCRSMCTGMTPMSLAFFPATETGLLSARSSPCQPAAHPHQNFPCYRGSVPTSISRSFAPGTRHGYAKTAIGVHLWHGSSFPIGIPLQKRRSATMTTEQNTPGFIVNRVHIDISSIRRRGQGKCVQRPEEASKHRRHHRHRRRRVPCPCSRG